LQGPDPCLMGASASAAPAGARGGAGAPAGPGAPARAAGRPPA
jgi:hypothetical protein